MITAKTIDRLREKTAADPGVAKRLLLTPSTAAVALLPAAKALLGDFYAWEPETTWLELERRHVDLPVENRVKLQAALTLYFTPSFYWDGIVFEKTAIAFAHEAPNPEALDEASVAMLAWAVKEAAWIKAWLGDVVPVFDHEPKAYTAVMLHREHYVYAPEQLDFAQGILTRMNLGDVSLMNEVRAKWEDLDKKTLAIHAFEETPTGVQLARLAAVELHVRECEARASADLASLT